MLKPIRHRTILDYISQYGTATMADLTDLIGCSAVTLRKDLRELHDHGLLRRMRGGAHSLGDSPLYEPPNVERLGQFAAEKRGIARHAVHKLVEDDDTIFLDAGTTTLEIAKELARCQRRVTVLTNSILATLILYTVPSIHLLVTGGEHRERVASLVGDWLEHALSTVRISTLFLGANAVDAAVGITTPNLLEAKAKRSMIEASSRVVLVADHSKLGRSSFAFVAPISAAAILLTDATASKALLEPFEQIEGLVVEIAPLATPNNASRADGDGPQPTPPEPLR